jgi:hypothetical protein
MAAFVDYAPTMATASMTMASHSMDHNSTSVVSSIDQHVESREESIEKLKSNLVRYARANDRRMVLRSLKDVSFLSYIPLEAPVFRSDVSMLELEKEASMEKVVLNGTLLNPLSKETSFKNAGTNSGCIMILKGLAKALCENSTLNGNTLYQSLLSRLVKSSSSADIYFQLNSMMGSADLNVKKLPSGNPSDLTLYNTGGQIHMTLASTFDFGLFRTNDTVVNRPWIVMKCKVYERANLSTNESFRSLNVQTPSLY